MAIADDFEISTAKAITYVGAAHGVQGGKSITTTNFVTGVRYEITTVGDTDFTLIGATENTVGAHFTATGPGTGTTGVADTVSAGYHTVIEFHRWLGDLADDAVASNLSSDFLDMTFQTPSDRQTDNIIQLTNSYNIDQTASEHLYDGSIIQNNGADIWDGLVVLANQGMNLQILQGDTANDNLARLTNDFWNYSIKGTATAGTTSLVLEDTTKTWVVDELIGKYVENTTEGCWGVITDNTATTITVAALYEGTNQDFASADDYQIVSGLNADAVSGYSHRMMLKVRTSGTDLDGRRIIGQTRVWGKTYSEFRIGTGTARGNNVLALTYADDLNNASTVTASAAVSVSNTTAGYNSIDVNADGTPETYYSQFSFTKPGVTINDFYEKSKWFSRQDSAQNLYGLNGELFRGVTHELDVDGGTGTHKVTSESEEITWGTGATFGTGQLIAADAGAGNAASGTTKIWFQLLTGVVPADNEVITGTTSTFTVTADLTTGALIERTLSFPYCGQSTGSALIGSYGLGLATSVLTSADKITALDGNVYLPPNVQNFFVNGLFDQEDYVLVGPYDSAAGNIDYDQLQLNGDLTTDNITSVVVSTAIPADTPASGYIRVEDNEGVYRRLHYSSWDTSTFTIDTTDGNEDFATVNATLAGVGGNVFISYVDELATGTAITDIVSNNPTDGIEYRITDVGSVSNWSAVGASSDSPAVGEIFTATATAPTGTGGNIVTTAATGTFQATYTAPRDLFVRVRDGGDAAKWSTPIKTFESSATFGSAGGSSTVIRTSDA